MASTAGGFSSTPARPGGTLEVQTNNSSSQSSAEKSNATLREQTAGAPANNGSSASGEDFDTDFELQLQGTTGSDWTPEEQSILESALSRFPADKYEAVERYIHVAASLPSKTARDVALRVKACGLDEKCRRGSGEDSNKRKAANGAQTRPGMHQGGKGSGAGAVGASGAGASGSGDDSSPGVPVALTQLMEQNYGILTQFKANMAAFKVMENTELLVRYRDNLMAIQQQLNSIGGTMGQMPVIPVQPNFDLANRFLPASTFKLPPTPMGTQAATMAAGTTAAAVASTALGVGGPMPSVGMAITGASAVAPPAPPAPLVGALASPLAPPPSVAAPTPILPMMPPFPFNPAAAHGLGHAAGLLPVMPHVDSFFGAAAMPGALGVMPPAMMPGALNPAAASTAAMGAVMPGAQFPFPMGAPSMLGCMPMSGGAMPAPTLPDAGTAAMAAAAAAVAAAQQAALPVGVQSSMASAPSVSRQGSAVQPLSVPLAVKQESGA